MRRRFGNLVSLAAHLVFITNCICSINFIGFIGFYLIVKLFMLILMVGGAYVVSSENVGEEECRL